MTNKYVGHCELFCIGNELTFGGYISHISLIHFISSPTPTSKFIV